MREYEDVYDAFKSKIDELEPEVQEVLFAMYPRQEDIEGYMMYPIESLQEIVEQYTLTPNTLTDAAVLLGVLQMKLNSV